MLERGCKARSNISLPELLWDSVHFSVTSPSEFHSSGQFEVGTFVRREHYRFCLGFAEGFEEGQRGPCAPPWRPAATGQAGSPSCAAELQNTRQQLGLHIWIVTVLYAREQLYCCFVGFSVQHQTQWREVSHRKTSGAAVHLVQGQGFLLALTWFWLWLWSTISRGCRAKRWPSTAKVTPGAPRKVEQLDCCEFTLVLLYLQNPPDASQAGAMPDTAS